MTDNYFPNDDGPATDQPGDTGSPGVPTTIYNKEQSFEEVAEQEAYQAFSGATGGTGGTGGPGGTGSTGGPGGAGGNQVGKTTEDMVVTLKEDVEKERDMGRLVENTKNAHSKYVIVEGKANIACASHGYIAGM